MNRDRMIQFIKQNHYVRITNVLFDNQEYLYTDYEGNVRDENGYLFEDWTSEGYGRHDGVRQRVGGNWEEGWYFYDIGYDIVPTTIDIRLMFNSLEKDLMGLLNGNAKWSSNTMCEITGSIMRCWFADRYSALSDKKEDEKNE